MGCKKMLGSKTFLRNENFSQNCTTSPKSWSNIRCSQIRRNKVEFICSGQQNSKWNGDIKLDVESIDEMLRKNMKNQSITLGKGSKKKSGILQI